MSMREMGIFLQYQSGGRRLQVREKDRSKAFV